VTKQPSDSNEFRLPALDGLRGIAIALVTGFHFLRDPGGAVTNTVSLVASAGWIGVDLFFVISGFLITGILLEAKGSPRYYRNFYVRRALRILPLYYGFLLFLLLLPRQSDVAAALNVTFFLHHQPWFWTHATNWLLASDAGRGSAAAGYGALWSLALEEQFYLVWPAVVATVSESALLKLCVALLAIEFPARILLALAGADPYSLYVSSFTHLDPLAVGGFLAIAARRGSLVRCRRRATWCAMLGSILFFVSMALIGTGAPIYSVPLSFMFSGVSLLWGGVLAVVIPSPRSRWTLPLRRGPLRVWGRYSYSYYLLQLPVSATLRMTGVLDVLPGYLPAAAVASATFTLSYFTWHLWEKRWLALKTRFPRRVAATFSAP
jgi:peptidoglycan/LPS O-acetylase OafA/YrhL